MKRLVAKIAYRFVVVGIGLAAGLALVAVYLVFTGGAPSLRDRDFLVPAEVYLFLIPFVAAIFVIPSTIREHRGRTGSADHEIKSTFWEPRDPG
ncbi:MAG TPA: hypothetical protein VG889_08100 [Rhizomicrobium sp.]|nr:hypothetical protein [Rhizomicrobium sp.]